MKYVIFICTILLLSACNDAPREQTASEQYLREHCSVESLDNSNPFVTKIYWNCPNNLHLETNEYH